MNKNRSSLLLAVLCALAIPLGIVGCVSSTAPAPAPTTQQQTIANAIGDTLAIGLVPVLTKNASYIPAAQGIAAAIGTFAGDTLTPADVEAVLAKTPLAPEDARTVAGLVNAAWATYAKRYAQQVNATVRPDVKLFLVAIADGINAAIAATPKPTASADTRARHFGALGVPAIS